MSFLFNEIYHFRSLYIVLVWSQNYKAEILCIKVTLYRFDLQVQVFPQSVQFML